MALPRFRCILLSVYLAMLAGAVAISTVGCERSEPGRASQESSGGSESSAPANAPTEAPPTLETAILESRAFNEAPALAERVEKGELPAVSDRLPVHPLVIVPLKEIGTYGGTLRRALTGDIAQRPGVSKSLSEHLMGYSRPVPKTLEHNIAESHEFLDGGRTVVLHIRKGIKWSDGVPFTVDDILFWYYDVAFNDNARGPSSPLPPAVWMVDDEPIRMEKIDENTLRISSPKPLGRVLQNLAGDNVAMPKHVLEKYHPKYNPQASYEEFQRRTSPAQLIMTPGMPQMRAWAPVEWVRGRRLVYERNPYYWKVDTAGNQLPYADRIEFSIYEDRQVILLKFMNGEFDLFGRYSAIDMYPTLKAEEKKGKFKVHVCGPERGPAIYLNWDCSKPALRQALRNKPVRIALSHAINRDEISQIVFKGMLDPSGYSFAPSSPYFSEAAYRKYTEYDADKARSLLEEAGYPDTDGDGFRELADGSRFELTVDIVAPGQDQDVCQLVASHWREVGVKLNLNAALRDIIWPRRITADFDAHIWMLEAPADPLGRLYDWATVGDSGPFWHRKAPRNCQPWFREASRCFRQAMYTIDQDKLRGLMVKARDLHTENIPVIVIGSVYHVWGANTRLGNVPTEGTTADVFRGWGRPVFHEQLFIRNR